MEWLRDRKNRLTVSILAAMAAAWWGTMYPEFCFSEGSGDSPRKISFWLAEVLEW